MRLICSNHAKAKYSCNLISIRRLESNRHFRFADDKSCRNHIFDIEEMNWPAFLDSLLPNFLSFNENVECSLPPLIAVVTHHEDHRIRRFNRQIEEEPTSTTSRQP